MFSKLPAPEDSNAALTHVDTIAYIENCQYNANGNRIGSGVVAPRIVACCRFDCERFASRLHRTAAMLAPGVTVNEIPAMDV